jgi:hypothetical protein
LLALVKLFIIIIITIDNAFCRQRSAANAPGKTSYVLCADGTDFLLL